MLNSKRTRALRAVILGGLLSSTLALAGSPPKEFMNMEACASASEASCTLEELLSINFPKAKLGWTKDGDNWILKVSATDKLSGATSEFSLELKKMKDKVGRNVVLATRASTMGQNRITGAPVPIVGDAMGYWNGFATVVFEKTGKKDPQLDAIHKLAKDSQDKAHLTQKKAIHAAIPGTYVSAGDSNDKFTATLLVSAPQGDSVDITFSCMSETKPIHGKAKATLEYTYSAESTEWRAKGSFTADSGCKGTAIFSTDLGNEYKPQVDLQGDCCRYAPMYAWKSQAMDSDKLSKQAAEQTEKENQEKSREIAAIKQGAADLSGKYPHRDPKQGGEFTVEIESAKEATIGFKKGACLFHHKVFTEKYGPNSLENRSFSGSYKEDECELSVRISYIENRKIYALTMEESGKCEKLCGSRKEDSLGLLGNYEKK